MVEERRAAERIALPEPVAAALGTTAVRIVDLSPNGARVQHEERIPVAASLELKIAWEGQDARIRVKVARSEIAGRSQDGRLYYVTGIHFETSNPDADGVIGAILRWARPGTPTGGAAAGSPLESSNPFLRDGDDDVPEFIRCELVEERWKTSYVPSGDQPSDGFTVPRERGGEIRDLQRVYEIADPDTRRMMRTAFAVQVTSS